MGHKKTFCQPNQGRGSEEPAASLHKTVAPCKDLVVTGSVVFARFLLQRVWENIVWPYGKDLITVNLQRDVKGCIPGLSDRMCICNLLQSFQTIFHFIICQKIQDTFSSEPVQSSGTSDLRWMQSVRFPTRNTDVCSSCLLWFHFTGGWWELAFSLRLNKV